MSVRERNVGKKWKKGKKGEKMEKMEHVANTGDRRDAALIKRRQKSKSNCRYGGEGK